jgi:tripartite motif-containing protein 71
MNRLAITTAAALGALAAFYAWADWVYEGQWGKSGTGSGEFEWVCSVDAAPNGNVYTLEYWEYDGRVQYFTATGSYVGQWKVEDEIYAVGVAPNTNVYVTAWNWVYYYTAAGSFLGSWGWYPHLYDIFGVDVAANGSVYVCDAGNDKIQYFTGTGSKLGEWGRRGDGDGEFNNPWGVEVAPNGDVYVADTYNHRVQYFNAAGSFKGKWGSFGSGNGQFDAAIDVAVGPDARVYVLDKSNYRVQYFTSAGSFLGKFGTRGKGPGQFESSYGLALSPDGRRLYVADTVNNRVQYFRWSDTAVTPASLGRVKALFR